VILPLTLVLIFGLLYLNTKSSFKAGVVMMAVRFLRSAPFWLLYLLGYNISIAVWVGMIALMGLDAETGVFMFSFSICRTTSQGTRQLRTTGDLVEAIIHGAVKRVRPKAMTVCAAFIGLLPIMWSTGTGADLMKRIAAPMVGGLSPLLQWSCWCIRHLLLVAAQEVVEGPTTPVSHEESADAGGAVP